MNNDKSISRRGFLKTAGATGAALTVSPALDKVKAAETALTGARNGSTRKKDGVEYRTLGTGRAAMEVSALGFGCMGMNYNRSQSPDRRECIRIIHEAVDRGVTLFDTAIIYGPLRNELLRGGALGTGRQDSSRATVRRYCEESLKRLRLDTIPLFYQHRYDRNTPIEDVAETISGLIREGKVQRWGLCEVSADTIRRAHAVCPLTAIQSEYHLMHRDVL